MFFKRTFKKHFPQKQRYEIYSLIPQHYYKIFFLST